MVTATASSKRAVLSRSRSRCRPQHDTPPFRSTAQVRSYEAATRVSPLRAPATGAKGSCLGAALDPSPIDPAVSRSVPSPTAGGGVATTGAAGRPGCVTPVGTSLDSRVPSPSWPNPLLPQQETAPVACRTQACASPSRDCILAVTATASSIPKSRSGVDRGLVVPSPNCPSELFSPQHDTPPSLCRTQALRSPTETATASSMRGTGIGSTVTMNGQQYTWPPVLTAQR